MPTSSAGSLLWREELTRSGVRPSDKISFLRMLDSADFAAAFLAAIWIGAIPVLQNSQFGRSELEHIIALCQPTALLVSENFAGDPATTGLSPHAPRLVVESVGRRYSSSGWIGGVRLRSGAVRQPARRSGLHCFHIRHDRQAERSHSCPSVAGCARRQQSARVRPRPEDVVLATGKWSFISALGHNVLFPLRNGVAGSIMDGRASPERILETIARDRVTLLYSVATLYRRILSSADRAGL